LPLARDGFASERRHAQKFLKKELSPEYRADIKSPDKISTTSGQRRSADCAEKSSAGDARMRKAGGIVVLVCGTAVADAQTGEALARAA